MKPFPDRELLRSITPDDITPEVSNMIYQYITRALREAISAKQFPASLSNLEELVAVSKDAESRNDILMLHWRFEIQRSGSELEKRLKQEKARREEEEERRQR